MDSSSIIILYDLLIMIYYSTHIISHYALFVTRVMVVMREMEGHTLYTFKYVCIYAHKRLSSQMSVTNVLMSNKCSSTLVVGTTSGCSQTLYPKQEGGGVKITIKRNSIKKKKYIYIYIFILEIKLMPNILIYMRRVKRWIKFVRNLNCSLIKYFG